MKRTLNEVYRICQKAAEGTGVPAGLDIDAAQNTAWLIAHGFTVLDSLACELEHVIGRDACSFEADGTIAATLDASDKPGALLAPSLVDLLIARAEEQAERIGVKNLSSPLYLLPAAVRYARDGWHFRFDLQSPQGGRFSLNVEPAGTRILGSAKTDIAILASDAVFKLDACCARDALPVEAPQLAVLVAGDALAASEAHSWATGVEVEAAEWQRLQHLAVRVLVPATEESRARGAGAKTSDNE